MEPYPFQLEGIRFLAARNRAILADAPGLGKTMQAIRATGALGATRVLVVCPNVVKWQWVDEIHKWDDPDATLAVCGQGSEGVREFADVQSLVPLRRWWNIIHWDALRLLPHSFFKVKWDVLIADEVHYICNRKAQRTRALKRIRATYKWGLSATPYRNWIDDLWSILNWLDKGVWSSYWRFYKEHICYLDSAWGREVIGERNLDRLASKLRHVVLRREKVEVARWLPPLTETVLYVDLTEEQRQHYERCRKDLSVQLQNDREYFILNPLARLTLLRRATSEARLRATEELLDNTRCPTVVFTYFKDEAAQLHYALNRTGWLARTITGDTPPTAREEALARFRGASAATASAALVMTISVGGVGLDLDEADAVVFAGASWSAIEMQQALERIHRITSTVPKQAYYVIAKDTIDEVVLWAAKAKADRQQFALAALKHILDKEV